jgi:hypothetical protein
MFAKDKFIQDCIDAVPEGQPAVSGSRKEV